MLETMRSLKESWLLKILIGLLVVTFVYFYTGTSKRSGGSNLHNPEAAAMVNHKPIYRTSVQHMAEQVLQQYGAVNPNDLPEQIRTMVLQQALERMIGTELLHQESQRVGLLTTDQELAEKIMAIPAFQVDGQFDAERYHRYNERTNFEGEYRNDLTAEKFQRFLAASVLVDDEEARSDAAISRNKVDVDVLTIDPRTLASHMVLSPAEIQDYATRHADDLKKMYDAHPERFTQAERVHARHILIKVAENAPTAEIQKAADKTQEVLKQLKAAPGKFAELAKRYSEDPGSKDRGGDLGMFERGRMTPAFEEAAFALKAGETSQPIRTPFGFHIIETLEHIAAKTTSFDDAKKELAKTTLAAERAPAAAKNLADSINAKLKAGQPVDALLKQNALSWAPRHDVSLRSSPFGTDTQGLALARQMLALNAAKKYLDAPVEKDGVFYVARFSKRIETKNDDSIHRLALEQRYANALLSNWVDYLKKKAKVEVAQNFKPAAAAVPGSEPVSE